MMFQMLQGVENIIQCEVTPPGFAARSLGVALVMEMDSTLLQLVGEIISFVTANAKLGWKSCS